MAFNIKDVISSMRDSFSPFDEGTGQFIQLNTEQAKKNLKLSERAAENGAKGIPRASTKSKDAMAEDIDAYLSHAISLAKDRLASRLHAINELNNHQSEGSPQAITEIYEAGKSELKSTARNHYNRLFSIRRRWILGERQLNLFRETNKIIGPARYPEDKTLPYGLLFFILVIELIVNAIALGGTHPEGAFGVVLEIIMFGVANIGAAFLLGNFIWRYFGHISLFKKLVAGVIATPMMVFLVFINFLLAHYRDALSTSLDGLNDQTSLESMYLSVQQLGAKAIEGLLASPFMLDDFKSYLLLFVGLLASIIATKKSFDLDDPYPGYGKMDRDQERVGESFNSQQDFSFTDMNDLVEDYSEQINGLLELLKGNEKALKYRQNDITQLYSGYHSWLEAIESDGKSLYAFYREENMKARKSTREPKSFVENQYALPPSAKVRQKRQKNVDGNYSTIERMCEKYLAELNKKLSAYQHKFKDIEKMSPDDVLSNDARIPTIFRD